MIKKTCLILALVLDIGNLSAAENPVLTPQNNPMNRPLEASQLEAIRKISQKHLADKKKQITTPEGIQLLEDVNSIHQQLEAMQNATPQQPVQLGLLPNETAPGTDAVPRSTNVESNSLQELSAISKKMKQVVRPQLTEANPVAGISSEHVRQKHQQIQDALDEALASAPEERSKRFGELAQSIRLHKSSDDAIEHPIVQPSIATLTHHRTK